MPVKVAYDSIERVSKVLARARQSVLAYRDDLSNPELYPPKDEDPELVARYLFFMVAIDHRMSTPQMQFEGYIRGKFYHGADALWRLGMIKFEETRGRFFDPENLSKISVEEIRSWLRIGDKAVRDPEIRAMLLRDAARKLLKFYRGSVMELIDSCQGYVRRGGEGIVELLKAFLPYMDPVEKKSFLLVKFLARRGLLRIRDPENLRVPVDNHLTRIAVRLGIVTVLDKEPFRGEREAAEWEDVAIRYCVREAYAEVAKEAGTSPLDLDDFLWSFGRKICRFGEPRCGECVLAEVCKARESGEFLNEHLYLRTWWY